MNARKLVPVNVPRILIVDDDDDSRGLFEIILSREGFEIFTAESGEHALVSMSKHLPDLVLIDAFMGAMSGYDLTQQLKANPATMHVPIIMISGLGDRNARTLALGAGAEALITKPVMRADLCRHVRDCLEAHRVAASLR